MSKHLVDIKELVINLRKIGLMADISLADEGDPDCHIVKYDDQFVVWASYPYVFEGCTDKNHIGIIDIQAYEIKKLMSSYRLHGELIDMTNVSSLIVAAYEIGILNGIKESTFDTKEALGDSHK